MNPLRRLDAWLRRRGVFWRGVVGAALRQPWVPSNVRVAALNRTTRGVAASARLYAGSSLAGSELEIAEGVFVNNGCRLHAVAPLTLERGVHLGPGVAIETSTHAIGPSERRAGAAESAGVRVGAGAWIGANALILPGVTIGPGAVIAAGAVVTKDCEADVLHGGVPARPIRRL